MLSNKNCFYKHINQDIKINIFVKNNNENKIITYQNLIKTPIYTKEYNYNNTNKLVLFGIIKNSPIPFNHFTNDLEFKNEEIYFNTFTDLCNIMNIPGIIILNSFCNNIDKNIFYEIYYYSNREDEYLYNLKKKLTKMKSS